MKKAARRTPLVSSIELEIRITEPAAANTHWRTAKWKGSPMFIRAAAEGLAAKDISTPRMISTPTAPSIQRSMVHHQTPTGVRSLRAKAWACCAVMRGRPWPRAR